MRKPKPRNTDSFVQLSRDFEDDMAGYSLAEVGLMSLILSNRLITPAGIVYRRHEWSDLAGSAEEVAQLLASLERGGKIVQAGNDILVRSWIRRNAFKQPNMLKSAAYSLSMQMRDPLQRTVIGTELLRKEVGAPDPSESTTKQGGRAYSKGRAAHYEALRKVWDALYDEELPDPETITGSTSSPNEVMMSHILNSWEFREALPQLEKREWACIHPEIAEALRARSDVPDVSDIHARRRSSG